MRCAGLRVGKQADWMAARASAIEGWDGTTSYPGAVAMDGSYVLGNRTSRGTRVPTMGAGTMRQSRDARREDRSALAERPVFVEYEVDRVLGLVAHPDFVMQVRAGRAAGAAHEADQVAAPHALPGAHRVRIEVAVAGDHAV